MKNKQRTRNILNAMLTGYLDVLEVDCMCFLLSVCNQKNNPAYKKPIQLPKTLDQPFIKVISFIIVGMHYKTKAPIQGGFSYHKCII